MHLNDADAKKARAVLAALGGTALVFLSWQPLNRLFANDRDNHVAIFLLFGLPLLLPGLWLFAYAVSTWASASASRAGGRVTAHLFVVA